MITLLAILPSPKLRHTISPFMSTIATWQTFHLFCKTCVLVYYIIKLSLLHLYWETFSSSELTCSYVSLCLFHASPVLFPCTRWTELQIRLPSSCLHLWRALLFVYSGVSNWVWCLVRFPSAAGWRSPHGTNPSPVKSSAAYV